VLKTIIKRDGSREEFMPHKLNNWAIWASDKLGDRVDWSGVVTEAVANLNEVTYSQDLQKYLIKLLIERKDWPHNLMAGHLYAAMSRKELYNDKIPTVRDLFFEMQLHDLMVGMKYSREDYDEIETIIDHSRDFQLAHFQIDQIRRKYSIQNRVTGKQYEMPQFTFMRMAMALAEDEPWDTRMHHLKQWYDHFSMNRINAPSPNYINLGTKHNGYASCCLYTTSDTGNSLAIGDHIAYKMTIQSAGIGNMINTRSVKDPIRGGLIVHKGKLPYYKAMAAAVGANTQAGRGGACTSYYSVFDPEAGVIANLQNERAPEDKKNRDIHFAMMGNRLFAKKVKEGKDIFTFTTFSAPDLMKKFFSGDQDGFEALYNQYENDPKFKKNYVNARDFLIQATTQSYEVGTHYFAMIDEMNRHTPFKEPIHSSNLCIEIVQPTAAYENMLDLLTDDDPSWVCFETVDGVQRTIKGNVRLAVPDEEHGYINSYDLHALHVVDDHLVKRVISKSSNPEVSMCSLAAIVEPNIESDEMYESAAYYALKMIDKCIHKSEYPLAHIGYTAKRRMNAGIGLTGVAHSMARENLKYDSVSGLEKLHEIAERHSFFVILASLKLGQELGNAPWIHKTKWPEGWLPIDTYKKSVDEITPPKYQYPWEALRTAIIANGGIRNSSLIAHMPTESSSKASGVPNSYFPIRELAMKKSDESNVIDWVAPNSDLYGHKYQIAWDIKTTDMIKVHAVFQKFTDQGISADLYKDRSLEINVSTDEMIFDYLTMVKYGMKGRYYMNIKTSSQETKAAPVCTNGSCIL
jgi:ribonucleoside-diphosphate reductase alpha chain